MVDPPGQPGRWPGLLAEWRRGADGWEGRVVFATPDLTGRGARLVERWLAAPCLEAAD